MLEDYLDFIAFYPCNILCKQPNGFQCCNPTYLKSNANDSMNLKPGRDFQQLFFFNLECFLIRSFSVLPYLLDFVSCDLKVLKLITVAAQLIFLCWKFSFQSLLCFNNSFQSSLQLKSQDILMVLDVYEIFRTCAFLFVFFVSEAYICNKTKSTILQNNV